MTSHMATQTKPQDDAGYQGKVGLEAQGLAPVGEVHWNLVPPVLIQSAVRRDEAARRDAAIVLATLAGKDAVEGSDIRAQRVGRQQVVDDVGIRCAEQVDIGQDNLLVDDCRIVAAIECACAADVDDRINSAVLEVKVVRQRRRGFADQQIAQVDHVSLAWLEVRDGINGW